MAMNFGSFASRVVATKVVATDGTGDFTDIQDAIDDLPSTGGVVYIKEGTYTITTVISITTNSVSIIGAGRATIIKATANIGMIQTNSEDTIIDSVKFLGNKSSSQEIILNDNTKRFVLKNCWIEALQNGLSMNNINNCSIINNLFNDCNLTAITAKQSVPGPDGTIIAENIFTSNGATAIDLPSNTNTVITGNVIYDSTNFGINISLQSKRTIVVGNVLKGNQSPQIKILSSTAEIGHNIIE